MHKALIMSATALMLNAMTPTAALAGEDTDIIDRPDFKSTTGIFDIDALEALGRVSEPRVSPDGKRVLFGVSYEAYHKTNPTATSTS